MAESKYEKYIRREVIAEDVSEVHPQITKPVLRMTSDESFGNHGFRLGWCPVTEPFEMVSETHAHDCDQYLIFVGGDATNMVDLGGEVELTLGEEGGELEKFVFTKATMVYVPAGLLHCPLNFRKVNDPAKPILFHDFFFSTEYKRKD
jgi:mannose-6-phosphate isomerase-like protein (cupin superfamily)